MGQIMYKKILLLITIYFHPRRGEKAFIIDEKYVIWFYFFPMYITISTAHTHTMETHSMEKVPSMENFSN